MPAVQWWYGHNAVGFLLTEVLGWCITSYRNKLSALFTRIAYLLFTSGHLFHCVFGLYPHHLHYTALPDWTQSVGAVMSVILFVPSGAAWSTVSWHFQVLHKLRTDPILRFLIVSLCSMACRPLKVNDVMNRLTPCLTPDWTVGHVHSGALGWVAMITIGSMYYLVPPV